jgi:hypothetical protein
VKNLSSREFHETIRQDLIQVSRRLATGELDGSVRYYIDAELATGGKRPSAKPVKANAA